jgi:hypothetical protein
MASLFTHRLPHRPDLRAVQGLCGRDISLPAVPNRDLDNPSAHKTSQVEQVLERNTHVKLHFTPTYSSWFNQVEI